MNELINTDDECITVVNRSAVVDHLYATWYILAHMLL